MNSIRVIVKPSLYHIYRGFPTNLSISLIESICYIFMTLYAPMCAITQAENQNRQAQLKLSWWWYNYILGCTGQITFPFQIFLVLGFMIGLQRTMEQKTGNLLIKALSPRTARKHAHRDVESILEREKGIPPLTQSPFSFASCPRSFVPPS